MPVVPTVLLVPTRDRRSNNRENKAATESRSARSNAVHKRNVRRNNKTRRNPKGSGQDAAAAGAAARAAETAALRQPPSQRQLRIHVLRSNRRASRAHLARLKHEIAQRRMEARRALKAMVGPGDGGAFVVAVRAVKAVDRRAAARQRRRTLFDQTSLYNRPARNFC
jgi:hypothetical protein